MRVCVFVDGENLRHTICDLFSHFKPADYLPKTADWSKFFDDVVGAVSPGAQRLRTYWYVVQHFDEFPKLLGIQRRNAPELDQWARNYNTLLQKANYTIPPADPDRTKILAEIQEDLTEVLHKIRSRFDGWTKLQNGIAEKHRAVEFRRSGAIPYNLTNKRFGEEKTVDVNLAVDMVMFAQMYDLAIIVSGDQDYVPAAQAIKNMGKSVVNVAFKARNGSLLPGGAKRLNHVTDWSTAVEWEDFRKVLGLPPPP